MTPPLNHVACPKCGREVDDRAVGCPYCGEKIYVETPADMTPTRHPPDDVPPAAPGAIPAEPD